MGRRWKITKISAARAPGLGGVGDTGGAQFAAAGPSANLMVGNPVNAGTGNKFQAEPDFYGAAFTGLSMVRYYNSADITTGGLGIGWHSTWHRGLAVIANSVVIVRPNGQQLTFTSNGSGGYTADPDVTSVLTKTSSGWALTLDDDSVEAYNTGGQLVSITARNGQVTTLAYSGGLLKTVTGPFGQSLSFTYDSKSRLHTMTVPDGGVFTYGYDANNNLTSVKHPDGTTRTYQYENPSYINALTGLIDEDNNAYANWQYDSEGRATSSQHAGGVDLTTITYNDDSSTTVTDADGNAHTYQVAPVFNVIRPVAITGAAFLPAGGSAFGYDANGFINSVTDFDGNVTTYVNNARGLPTREVDASGTAIARTTTTTWETTFHLPQKIVEPNRSTTFTYDANGNLKNKTVTDDDTPPLSRSWNYTYTALGQVHTAKDPDGNTTTYTYNAQGGMATLQDALGHVWHFTAYDANGRLKSMTDPNGLVTSYTYDAMGRLLTSTVGTPETQYKWDPAGMLAKVINPDASTLTNKYDPAHRLIQVTDTAGDYQQRGYDAASNLTSLNTYDPSNTLRRTVTYEYANNQLSIMIGGGTFEGEPDEYTFYDIDPQGNLLSVIDPNGNESFYTPDALNRLKTYEDPAGKLTTYTYNPNNHVTQIKDPRGLLTNYTWNGLDELTAISSPDSGASSATYFASGLVQKTTDARGDTAVYVYDALERRKTITYSDGRVTTYTYDTGTNGIGHLTGLANEAGTTSWSYNQRGQVLSKEQIGTAVTLTVGYGYDSFGRLNAITYPSGKVVDYGYDTSGRVDGLTHGGASLVSAATYFPFGMAENWAEANGSSYARTIDEDGRITGIAVGGTVNVQVPGYDYGGRITGLTETGLAAKSYTYDPDDRLLSLKIGTATTDYKYDLNGNRTSVVTGAGTITYHTPAASNRLGSLSGLIAQTDSYDASGDLLTDGTVTYAYDARGRMASAKAAGVTTDYAIDGLGQRIGKGGTGVPTGGAAAFAYDEAGHLLGEYTSAGAVIEETVNLPNGGRTTPVAVLTGTGASAAVYSLSPDWLDAPHIIQNASKQTVWRWDHLGFGDSLPTGTLTYNPRFPGQYYDAESGLNYNMARDYNPNIGRYVESDPFGLLAGINTYAYAGGNPLLAVDPRGLVGEQYVDPAMDELEALPAQLSELFQWASQEATALRAAMAASETTPALADEAAAAATESAAAETSQPFALGLNNRLCEFASQQGANTWRNLADPENWQQGVLDKLADPNTPIYFNLDGVDVWAGLSRFGNGSWGPTDWELGQIYQNPQWWSTITWFQNGQPVTNPFQ